MNFTDPVAALKHYFGFDSFLDGQQEVVESILRGEDLGVIMPTGAGKSICYQLPVLMKEGYGIVASPLIVMCSVYGFFNTIYAATALCK